jgi:hypothetical protein
MAPFARAMHRWLPGYLLSPGRRRRPSAGQTVHLILCIADHFEPKLGGATASLSNDRVRRWVDEYPKQFAEFRDSDGKPPQHTFFYPIDEYEPRHVDSLAELCRGGFGEVEVHLHHDRDTAENLRRTLTEHKRLLAEKYGLLSRDQQGQVRYAFIHGNWALNNARRDGRWCGVNNEIDILRETGCYVDMTMPSAPDETQTKKINSIYYATGCANRPKCHDRGVDVGRRAADDSELMLIQGPLVLDWARRKWKILPRLENGCLQGSQPPSPERLTSWLRARVQIAARPDWYFVKLHTHGANEANMPILLGEPMRAFHRFLAERSQADSAFRYHYVTAREMYNLAKAAESGWTGDVASARDLVLLKSFD